jgi:retinol dehydrogenase-12
MLFYCARFANSADGTQSLNPGNWKTPLQRHVPGWQYAAFRFALHTPIHGAYTELFAGLSPDVIPENNGAWIIPWGRINSIRKDIEASAKTEAEGGSGKAAKFWEWSEEQVKSCL